MPGMTCWPDTCEWASLNSSLKGVLHKLRPEEVNAGLLFKCQNASKDIFDGKPFEQQSETTGICLYNMNCFTKGCLNIPEYGYTDGLEPNVPSYAVTAADVDDIVTALMFANKHDIIVTVRVHGHSYTESSSGSGTLLIWMHNFTKYGDIEHNFVDACGQDHGPSLKIGGGQTWTEAYYAAGEQWELSGGWCPSVAPNGGWLLGGGLANHFSRKNGLGVDNVLQLEVVLANGSFVKADACSHPDLFWALRGGGGGTFGVVTAAQHRIRPSAPFMAYSMGFKAGYNKKLQRAWGEFWAKESPHLDRRWNGGFSGNQFNMLFHGSAQDANATFIDRFTAWKAALPLDCDPSKVVLDAHGPWPNYLSYIHVLSFWIHPGWWSRGRVNQSSWVIPHDWVVANPEAAAELITDSIHRDTYWLGGAIGDAKIDETSVNPGVRKGVWDIITGDEQYAKRLRELFPDSGSEYNHGSAREPNYRHAFWGSNYPRLREIKITYDPEQRFKCPNCVDHEQADPCAPLALPVPAPAPPTSAPDANPCAPPLRKYSSEAQGSPLMRNVIDASPFSFGVLGTLIAMFAIGMIVRSVRHRRETIDMNAILPGDSGTQTEAEATKNRDSATLSPLLEGQCDHGAVA